MALKNYKVTAKTANGRTITDTFYVANEREARIDFRACYRNEDYTIVEVVPDEPDTVTDAELLELVKIARKNIPSLNGREDLEAQHMDEKDFLDVAVWCLKDALIAAYELGKATGKKEASEE